MHIHDFLAHWLHLEGQAHTQIIKVTDIALVTGA